MRYYVDTEFNGTTGQLLSIALVGQDGASFYRELHVHELVVPWVKENVMSHMTGPVVSRAEATKALRKFLEKDTTPITFVADWPEDLQHVLSLMLREHGKRNPPLRFRMVLLNLAGFHTEDHSTVPHNSLRDAVSLQTFVELGILDGQDGELENEDLRLLRGT